MEYPQIVAQSPELAELITTYDPRKLIEPLELLDPEQVGDGLYVNRIPELDPNKKLLFVVIGPSGGGKDTAVVPLEQDGTIIKAVTGTTRARRLEENEPENAYVWMRQAQEGESHDQYRDALIAEYELLEIDNHHGNYYGLPEQSVVDAAQGERPVLVRTDSAAVPVLSQRLGDRFNIITTFVTPPDFETLWNRMQARENPETRFADSIGYYKTALELSEFILLNQTIDPTTHPEGLDGKQVTSNTLRNLISYFEKLHRLLQPQEP